MTPRRWVLVIAVAFLLVTAGTVGADTTLTFDADHPLATEEAVDRYHETGRVSAELQRIQLTITLEKGTTNHVLTLDYEESVPRTIRLYFPAGYFYPQVMEGLGAVNTDLEADLKPVDNGSHTSVTVKFDGARTAVFHISKENSAVFWGRDKARGAVDDSFGISLPSIARTSPEWRYVPMGALNGVNATHPIDTQDKDITIQYDDNPEPDEERWIGVPQCKDVSEQPVCQFEKQGINDTVYLFSTLEESPTVRYRRGGDLMAGITGGLNDFLNSFGRALDEVGKLFGVVT